MVVAELQRFQDFPSRTLGDLGGEWFNKLSRCSPQLAARARSAMSFKITSVTYRRYPCPTTLATGQYLRLNTAGGHSETLYPELSFASSGRQFLVRATNSTCACFRYRFPVAGIGHFERAD
jgi:hypothetical protein